MKPRWGAAALALLLAASAAAQQGEGGSGDPATQIRPDASPALSLGTRVSQSGNVHLIDGGTRAGANLFHSFARFDLGRGDVARWTHGEGGASSIRNIVSRVTGGTASTILGTLDSSALPNADFWFVNPAGILVGQGARVNVPASLRLNVDVYPYSILEGDLSGENRKM